jgi:hypothetical protein
MKPLPIAMSLFAMAAFAPPVLADDDQAACFDAAEKGQVLRQAHKAIEARDQFRLCIAPTCPATMRKDCSGWLDESEKAIPTVVLSAKDAAGNDVFDVSVTMDDALLATKLEGTSLPVDPGPHTFRFQWPDGARRETQILAIEGQKDLVVTASLAPPGRPASAPLPLSQGTPAASLVGQPPAVLMASGGTVLHMLGWIAGGVGVAGLAVGGIFTGVTVADKSAANCNAAKKCTNFGSLTDAQSAAPIAGTGFIAGGALVVAGDMLLLLPHTSKEAPTPKTSSLRVTPIVERQAGGAMLQGNW